MRDDGREGSKGRTLTDQMLRYLSVAPLARNRPSEASREADSGGGYRRLHLCQWCQSLVVCRGRWGGTRSTKHCLPFRSEPPLGRSTFVVILRKPAKKGSCDWRAWVGEKLIEYTESVCLANTWGQGGNRHRSTSKPRVTETAHRGVKKKLTPKDNKAPRVTLYSRSMRDGFVILLEKIFYFEEVGLILI